jgi:hypothetical protein
VSEDRASFVARVIGLYLEDPDTPQVPSSADWDIAHDLYDRGIPLETVRLAFQIAFVRRRARTSAAPLPPIRSLAYFRTVALNLTPDERDPAYTEYVDDLHRRLTSPPAPPTSLHPAQNRGEQPESGGFS